MDAAKKAWDGEGRETVQIFGGEEFEADLMQCRKKYLKVICKDKKKITHAQR